MMLSHHTKIMIQITTQISCIIFFKNRFISSQITTSYISNKNEINLYFEIIIIVEWDLCLK